MVSLRRLCLIAPAVLAAVLAAPSAAQAAGCATVGMPGGDWPTYGADAANSRYQEHEKVISPADVPLLSPAWTFSTQEAGAEGDITGTPVVAGGCLYVATSRGWVFALNADTGEVVWKSQVPYGGGINSTVGLSQLPLPRGCGTRRSAKRKVKRRAKKRRARAGARKRRAKRRVSRGCAKRPARRKRARRKGKRPSAKRAVAAGQSKAKRRTKRRKRRTTRWRQARGGVNVVYVAVARTQASEGCPPGDPCEGPYVAAFNGRTGELLWATPPIDTQPGSDVYGSPILFDGMLLIGVSGGSAELGDEADRYAFQGSMNFLDATSGRLLRKTYTIHPPLQPDNEFAGAGIWSTPAIDKDKKVAYAGTANPFKPQAEHKHANAVVKFDIDRGSPTFGDIVGSYKGDIDEYVPGLSELPCYDFPNNNPPYYPQGIGSCGDIDLDFGASPNLFTGPDGRKLVGAGQKSGVSHVFDAETMQPVWKQIVGPPTALGGIVGSTAHDGESVYGPVTIPGYVWSLSAAGGEHRWVAGVGDGAHWGPPVAVANEVVYSVDLTGFLNAWDARTGVQLAKRPLQVGGSGPVSSSWGAVSVARNTVYAGVGLLSLADGFVVAFRRGGAGDLPEDVGETGGGGGGSGGGGGGGGSGDTNIVAGPGATYSGYATPVVTTKVGGPVSFVNLDPVQHDVTSDARGPDGRPLFASRLSGIGEVVPVEGLDRVQAGQDYGFFCSIHPGMRGTLLVR
jgi:outer membrane protein assembly factor BamB/plastocyanin